MNILKNIITVVFFTILSVTISRSQDMQADYNSAVTLLKSLKNKQDSTQNLITKNRQLLENRPENKETYSKAIIALEDQLYEIDAQIAKVSAQVLSIEALMPKTAQRQETTKNTTGSGVMKESRNLFQNYFFTNNLSTKEITRMNQAAGAELRAGELIRSIEATYDDLMELKEAYDSSQSQKELDEMLVKSIELRQQIAAADSEIGKVWTELYNFKIDKYLILADKLSGVDRLQLEQIDNDHRAVRRAESLAEGQIAPNAVIFPLQKELTLHYEILLASNLELKLAQDSLSRQLRTLNKNRLDLPKIEFEPRVLVVYSDVTMDGKYGYKSVDSIPELIVPTQGVYYSVQVATMPGKPTSLSFFKGGRPLHLVKLANGQNQYVLGGFKTYAKAQACVNQLYKLGYRAPAIVAWVNGQNTTAAKAKVIEEELAKINAGEFKIEIRTKNSAMGSSLREIVDSNAKDKQISRVQDGQEFIFTILQFNDKSQAEKLAEIIRIKENTKAEVSSVK